MVDSPLIPQDIKDYIKRNKLIDLLNKGVNEIFRKKPLDPLTAFANFFLQNSDNIPTLEKIEAREIPLNEFAKTLEVAIFCNYSGQVQVLAKHKLAYTSKSGFNLDADSEGMATAANVIKTAVTKALHNRSLTNVKSSDEVIVQLRGESPELNLGENILNVVSYAVAKAIAFSKSLPLYKYVSCAQRNSSVYGDVSKLPRLMLTCLRGGKAYNSKVKFARFMYIYEGEAGKPSAVKDVSLLYAATRKMLASGKLGEAGVKSVSGSFLCLMDTIGDALKILEETIKTLKLPNVKIGIICGANDVYNEGTGKYEMEGPKSQFDNNQMVEYYVKFLNEHPLVCYLEDPMADKDPAGWGILTRRMKLDKPDMDIACNSLFGSSAKKIAECTTYIIPEGFTEEQKKEEEYQTKYDEVNEEKFIPNVVVADSMKLGTLTGIIELGNSLEARKIEERMNLLVSDFDYETEDTTAVDLGFGLRTKYINISGLTQFEHISKVGRYSEICEEIGAESKAKLAGP